MTSAAAVADGTPAALALEGVTCVFASRESSGQRYVAVQDVNLAVAPGEFVSVVGPTGCGKSTLLNVGAGLLTPSSGQVRVFGQPLAGLNRRAGYMFQAEALMPWKTALANVMAGLIFRAVPRQEAEQQARDWLARVGLAGFEERYPHQLSGGMRKRVAMAQTLILDPDIILMDEPFSALDIQTRQLMENELLDLWADPARQVAREPLHESARAGAPGFGMGCEAQSAAIPSGIASICNEADRPKPGCASRDGFVQRFPRQGRAVLFITHDLDEAIALSDRVVVLSAGPATHPIGEFVIDLPRPRNVAEIRDLSRFAGLHAQIWAVLREEVLMGYDQQKRRAAA